MIRLIILEKLVKVALVAIAVVSLLVLGGTGMVAQWAVTARRELLVGGDINLLVRVLDWLLSYAAHLSHPTSLALVLLVYGAIEGTEGVGLYLRRRWAEYLTVLATGFLIPYEVYEVIRHATLFKEAALIANVAIVLYLAWRKRLFTNV